MQLPSAGPQYQGAPMQTPQPVDNGFAPPFEQMRPQYPSAPVPGNYGQPQPQPQMQAPPMQSPQGMPAVPPKQNMWQPPQPTPNSQPQPGQFSPFGAGPQTPSPTRAPMQPMTQQMQGFGRGRDSTLVHMSPREVGGLQALAQAHGGSLTTNPMTGLPEAGFLESILPMIAGGLLTMTGIGAPLAALMVGGGTGLATGSLEKGLMAGLGAFGGAGLGAAMGAGAAGAALPTALPGVAGAAGADAATTAALGIGDGVAGAVGAAAPGAVAGALPGAAASAAPGVAGAMLPQAAVNPLAAQAAQLAIQPGGGSLASLGLGQGAEAAGAALPSAASAATPSLTGIPSMIENTVGHNMGTYAQRFHEAVGQGFGGPSMTKTAAAGMGLAAPVLQAMQPQYKPYKEDKGWNYEGPYLPTERHLRSTAGRDPNDSSEFQYFDTVNPYPGFQPAPRMADGGAVDDRALRPQGAGYQAGMGPEHDWNFHQVALSPTQQSHMDSLSSPTAAHDYGNSWIARALGDRAKKNAPTPVAGNYRYNRATQSLEDMDNADNGSGGLASLAGAHSMGGSGGAGLGQLDMGNYASGGHVPLRNGAFVVDARTVSELGNGSSGAGQELLARHGGQPLRGPGDGVSDSIPAQMRGGQRARVARDEVKFDPEAVARLGGGDPRKGAQKLYALMDKAQKARKAATRGQDTRLRKALPA